MYVCTQLFGPTLFGMVDDSSQLTSDEFDELADDGDMIRPADWRRAEAPEVEPDIPDPEPEPEAAAVQQTLANYFMAEGAIPCQWVKAHVQQPE